MNIKKIDITKEQLDTIEMWVVAYMITVENKIGLSADDVKNIVSGIDKKWDDSFNVSEESKNEH